MISSLRGTVLAVSGGRLLIEVGGVGYAVAVTPRHALALRDGQEALVHTALVVREDELSLCGFATREELEVFELLREVTGVGPKSALGVLAQLAPAQIAAAVAAEDDAAFRRVSGIGPKTAKLIVVTLSGKLDRFADVPTAAGRAEPRGQARHALVSLGFPERQAQQAVDDVLGEEPGLEVGVVVRRALALLGPAGVR